MKIITQTKVLIVLTILVLLPITLTILQSIIRTQTALTQADNTLKQSNNAFKEVSVNTSENIKANVSNYPENKTNNAQDTNKINTAIQDDRLLQYDKQIKELDRKEQSIQIEAIDARTASIQKRMGEGSDNEHDLRLSEINHKLAEQMVAIKQEKYQIAVEKMKLTQEKDTVKNVEVQQSQAIQEVK